MKKSHRFLRDALFASALGSILFVISCVELGPVPEFKYAYEFETDLPETDTTALAAENVEITEGSVDNSGASAFADALGGSGNAAVASDYAANVGSTISANQQEYWEAQTPASIATALDNGSAVMTTNIASAIAAIQSNATLSALIPSSIAASGGLSTGGRIGGAGSTTNAAGVKNVQQDNLDDCKQAAQDAFLEAKDKLDSIKAVRLAAIDKRFAGQMNAIAAFEAPLAEAALTRHNDRKVIYLNLYNTISAAITSLYTSGDITEPERKQLNIVNGMIYAFLYQATLNLYNSELALIDGLIVQAKANLTAKYNTMVGDLNNAYNAELGELQRQRDQAQNSCHDQGGIHDQGGSGPN